MVYVVGGVLGFCGVWVGLCGVGSVLCEGEVGEGLVESVYATLHVENKCVM